MIEVAGGYYNEFCTYPYWRQIFGSGGRAAAALASSGIGVKLYTYIPNELREHSDAFSKAFGFDLESHQSDNSITFDYLYSLGKPRMTPSERRIVINDSFNVKGEIVLRFGFLEGDAIVEGDRVIYDPQSYWNPKPFSANGSRAERLAIVGNGGEIRKLGNDSNLCTAASKLLHDQGAEVVIAKRGPWGASVYSKNEIVEIPVYLTNCVFGIGSGDIFSAAFAKYWAVDGLESCVAADLASRSAACYCNSKSLNLLSAEQMVDRIGIGVFPPTKKNRVYLAGPFFNLAQRWLVEEARERLVSLGLDVFSPLHDVGIGNNAKEIAEKDLQAIDSSDCVLALLDGEDAGTIFEIGYARANKIPVIAFANDLGEESATMIVGSGCELIEDFSTALYKTFWTRKA